MRFGAAPPPDCGDREEAFMLADKVLLQQSVFYTIGNISIVIVFVIVVIVIIFIVIVIKYLAFPGGW